MCYRPVCVRVCDITFNEDMHHVEGMEGNMQLDMFRNMKNIDTIL